MPFKIPIGWFVKNAKRANRGWLALLGFHPRDPQRFRRLTGFAAPPRLRVYAFSGSR